MTINDYEKIMKELEKEYNRNVETIKDLEQKIKIINLNKFETKFSRGLWIALIPTLIMMFSSIPIISHSIISTSILSPLIIGIPAVIGMIGQSIYNKVNKSKELMNEFCNARTEKEKIEEETKLTIEKNKLNNRNKVLNNNIKKIEKFIETSNMFNLSSASEMVEDNHSNQFQVVEQLKAKLKEQYNRIDVFTTRKKLSRKFLMFRDKKRAIKNIISDIFVGGFFPSLLAGIPFVIEMGVVNISTSTIIQLVSTMLIGATATGIYSLKNYSDSKKVFKKINETLGEDSLTENEDLFEALSNYDNDLEDAISLAAILQLYVELENAHLKSQENSERIEQPLTLNNVYDNSIVQEPKVKIATLRSDN